jgi:hypothetical protein
MDIEENGGEIIEKLTGTREQDDEQTGVSYWLNWIKAAEKAGKEHLEAYRDAQAEYLGKFQMVSTRFASTNSRAYRLPVFWSAMQSVLPAYYSSMPIPVVEAEWAQVDRVANEASEIAESLAKYYLKINNCDQVFTYTSTTALLADKATDRVLYVENEGEGAVEEIAVFPSPIMDELGQEIGTQYLDANGAAVADGTEIMQDEESGAYFYESAGYEKCIKLMPVAIADVLHTPTAKTWEEVQEIAFRVYLTKQDARDMFGKEQAARLNYGKRKKVQDDATAEKVAEVQPVAEIWEIWDKRSKTVRYISKNCERYLKPVEAESAIIPDPYKLVGFFPCPPFVLGTCSDESMYPVPPHTQLKDVLNHINGIYKRVCKLTMSTKRRGVFDANVPELAVLQSETDESEFVPVANFRSLVGEGGLDRVVQYFPVDQLAQAMGEMQVALKFFTELFNECYGLPDVIRGTSSPVETAEAQKIKERNASLRFSARQRQFQELVRKSVELMVDLSVKQLTEDEIGQIVGVRFKSQEKQQIFAPAVALLRTDKWRTIRINIETDSTILPNEEENRRRKVEVVNAITSGIQQMAQVQGLPPPLVGFIGKLITYMISGMRDAKALTGDLDAAIKQSLEAMQAPQDAPPPPDYEGQKLQLQQQSQTNDAQIAFEKLKLDVAIADANVQLEREKLSLEAQKIGAAAVTAQNKSLLDERIASFEAEMRKMELQLAQQTMVLTEREKYMTEQRLQLEAALKQQEAISKQQALAQQMQPQQSPIELKIEAPKPVKRKYKIKRDAFGNSEISQETEEPGA